MNKKQNLLPFSRFYFKKTIFFSCKVSDFNHVHGIFHTAGGDSKCNGIGQFIDFIAVQSKNQTVQKESPQSRAGLPPRAYFAAANHRQSGVLLGAAYKKPAPNGKKSSSERVDTAFRRCSAVSAVTRRWRRRTMSRMMRMIMTGTRMPVRPRRRCTASAPDPRIVVPVPAIVIDHITSVIVTIFIR